MSERAPLPETVNDHPLLLWQMNTYTVRRLCLNCGYSFNEFILHMVLKAQTVTCPYCQCLTAK